MKDLPLGWTEWAPLKWSCLPDLKDESEVLTMAVPRAWEGWPASVKALMWDCSFFLLEHISSVYPLGLLFLLLTIFRAFVYV